MSGSGLHRLRTPLLRPRLVVGAATAVCAVLTIGQLLVPVVASAHPGGSATTAAFLAAGGHRQPDNTGTPTPTPVDKDDDPNPNCTLIVPPAPLSAAGLATPYRFLATRPDSGACHEANTDQSAFVEAAILNPATGSISVYHPLVIDDGTRPAVDPVRPTLPPGAVVGVWFGFQATNLTLRTRHVRHGAMDLRSRTVDGCVNGLGGSAFGQFAYCGAPQFFAAANIAIRSGKLIIPGLGTGRDRLPCPSTRDFGVVDQDQSDNLPTTYLATADGRTAQSSAANAAALHGTTVLSNASDNGLVDDKLDPALGCHPLTAPDLSAGGRPTAALALNELQAAAHQGAPVALVPPNDPMAQVDGKTSMGKTNLYRVGVDQPLVNQATDTGAAYCTELATVAVPRLSVDKKLTSAEPSPDPAVAKDLHGFLVARLNDSWGNLGCPDLIHRATPDKAAAAASSTRTRVPITSPTTDPAANLAAPRRKAQATTAPGPTAA